ncbi:hypothetical protein BLNAU_18984 [Blattamonas nauphoetae]|uniref:Cyclin N-terminal domain-containing protein n=1 Tax=Blattamonas nauphoetae TaxID=2049346 RepID=A0ABQ9X607_9EUKA|nr:hypothetical protein BLNAU_18984 [Blattamonas nauphoetae]
MSTHQPSSSQNQFCRSLRPRDSSKTAASVSRPKARTSISRPTTSNTMMTARTQSRPNQRRSTTSTTNSSQTRSTDRPRSHSPPPTVPRVLPQLQHPPPHPPSPIIQTVPIDQSTLAPTSHFVTELVYSLTRTSPPPPTDPNPLYCVCCSENLARMPLFSLANQINEMMPEDDFCLLIARMIGVLSNSFRIRRVELIGGVSLFASICSLHWHHPFFVLVRNNLHATLLTCVMLMHKVSADAPIRNEFFASSFGVPLFLLNEIELGVLLLRDWKVNVSYEEYVQTADRMGMDSW